MRKSMFVYGGDRPAESGDKSLKYLFQSKKNKFPLSNFDSLVKDAKDLTGSFTKNGTGGLFLIGVKFVSKWAADQRPIPSLWDHSTFRIQPLGPKGCSPRLLTAPPLSRVTLRSSEDSRRF
jgi:hypothetical protein